MAQDATGTPTAKGIPKFNTAVDAPSGKGFNAAMDVIDGLIIPDTIVDAKGDLIAATGADVVTRLAVGSNGQVLTADSAEATGMKWAAGASVTYQTTLPGSPTDGQETILVDSTTAPTYSWRLRYNSTLAKWEYIGGRSAYSEVTASEACASATYIALATAGPSIVLPVAGDYDVEIGFSNVGVSSGPDVFMSYDIGGTGAVDADAALSNARSNGFQEASAMRLRRKTGLTAVTLTAKYRGSGVTSFTIANRWMRVTPVKLG